VLAEADDIRAGAGGVELARGKYGWDKPDEVREANEEWKAENDQLGRFIADCCVLHDDFRAKARPLFEHYRKWAEGSGEGIMTETMFGNRLKARGLEKEHTRVGAEYVGMANRSDAE